MGNYIRTFAGSDFSKGLFEQFWLAKGDLWLNKDQFDDVVDAADKAGAKEINGIPIVLHGNEYLAKVINFYNSEKYAKAFGRATLIYTKEGKAVGFFDTYDFDTKDWGIRPALREVQTRGVIIGSYFSNARNYRIFYNMGVLYSQTYIK